MLKQQPPETEAARRFALHALTLNDVRFPSGRIEDWTTLAIASAVTGHDVDARNAWFVALALTSDLQRLCNAAVSAEASYGERLRPSVQALLQRVRLVGGLRSLRGRERGEARDAGPSQGHGKAAPRPRRPIP